MCAINPNDLYFISLLKVPRNTRLKMAINIQDLFTNNVNMYAQIT